MTDDDLDALLAPRPPAAADAAFRDALFRRTRRTLAARRWGRRVAVAAGVGAVFLAGGAAGWVARPVPASPVVRAPDPVVVTVFVPVPVPAAVPSSPGPVAAVPSAADAEVKAELADDPAEAARLYRTAGDRYLADRDDYANAARCYRLFLARAGDAGLTPTAADSWLLASLKNAAFKEKSDATKRDG